MLLKNNIYKNSIYLLLFVILAGFIFVLANPIKTLAETELYEPVTVEYLVQIDNTPFCIRQRNEVRVPVQSGYIKKSDVAKTKVGNRALGVLSSACTDFYLDSKTGYYVACYMDTVYIEPRTTDGNSAPAKYFFDLNKSYYQYFVQFLEPNDRILFKQLIENKNTPYDTASGDISILPYELVEWYFNKLTQTFPALLNYYADQIYGYWGFIPIPKSYSYDAQMKNLLEHLFKFSTTFEGVLDYVIYDGATLSIEAYTSLLNDYKYDYIDQVIFGMQDLLSQDSNVNCYMFYASGEYTYGFINENGATSGDDHRGSMIITTEKAVTNFGNAISDAFSKLNADGTLKKLFGGILGALGAVLIIIVILKFMPSRAPRAPSEKEEKPKKKKSDKTEKTD